MADTPTDHDDARDQDVNVPDADVDATTRAHDEPSPEDDAPSEDAPPPAEGAAPAAEGAGPAAEGAGPPAEDAPPPVEDAGPAAEGAAPGAEGAGSGAEESSAPDEASVARETAAVDGPLAAEEASAPAEAPAQDAASATDDEVPTEGAMASDAPASDPKGELEVGPEREPEAAAQSEPEPVHEPKPATEPVEQEGAAVTPEASPFPVYATVPLDDDLADTAPKAPEASVSGEPTLDSPASIVPASEGPVSESPVSDAPAPEAPATETIAVVAPAAQRATSAFPGRGEIPAPAAQPEAARPVSAATPSGVAAASDVSPGSPLDAFDDQQPKRTWPRALAVVGGVVIVLAAGYVGASWALADRVPRGTTVAGVEIGGLSSESAVATLESALGALADEQIPVSADGQSLEVSPAEAGLSFDASATVGELTGFTLEPKRLWQHAFGDDVHPPVTVVEDALLTKAVAAASDALATEPVDGSIVFADGVAHATAAQEGSALDEANAAEVLRAGWLTSARPIALPTRVVAPAVTQAETDRVLAQVAKPIAAAPVSLEVADQLVELPARVVAGAASFTPKGGTLELAIDGEALVKEVLSRTTDLLDDAKDAKFEFKDGKPTIVKGKAGTTLDPDALATAVATAATSGEARTATVALVETDPKTTTAQLEELGIKEIVQKFSTPITNEVIRTKNLARGAELVTGHLVKPGETFSLVGALTPITAANGYHYAHVVVDGVITQGIGGGLSQMGTTVFNASYLAGFEDVEHRPHSYWFSRYPEGRESTIYEGAIDVKFKNTSPYGALLRSYVSGGSLHVEIWGTKHFDVKTSKSGRSNVVAPKVLTSDKVGCTPQSAGNSGFTVTNYRTVSLDGEVVDDSSYTWTYRPQNGMRCESKKDKDAADRD